MIPAVAGLTDQVLAAIKPKYGAQIAGLKTNIAKHDIEILLSRIRSLSGVIGTTKVHDLDGDGYRTMAEVICVEVGKIVQVRLPAGTTAYGNMVSWITGAPRTHAVEIFTTNYDLLFEEAFERMHAPCFDGFTGAREAFFMSVRKALKDTTYGMPLGHRHTIYCGLRDFPDGLFDPASVSSDLLPARWTRLWKIHGSLGWKANEQGEVIRTGQPDATHLVYPEHQKYDQTQKAPYATLLDRLRSFLATEDTLLLSIGFSYGDAHIAARIDEALAANPAASVFAFQFQTLDREGCATELAFRRSNFSVYARDSAVINGIATESLTGKELSDFSWL